jgi:HK97 family phage major capsid protein
MDEIHEANGGIFVPVEVTKALNMLIRDASCVEALASHIPMKRLSLTRRKQSTGVDGYWVDAMAVKTKDAPTFEPYTLTAEKMAVIIPVEDQLLEDADTDIAAVLREDVTGAFAELLDRTYMGYEITSPFGNSLSGNTPVANTIVYGTGVDLAADFSLAMAALEANGFYATGAVAHPVVKHQLRNLRDWNNQPIFAENLRDGVTTYTVFGVPICFTRQVEQDEETGESEILLLYKPYVIIGDRQELQISVSNEATLTQGTEDPINLWEMDMTALRYVLRKGFVVKDDNALAKITDVPGLQEEEEEQ